MGVNGIYGLSGSGMDIESMVKVGMMSKQNEYDKMAQKFTKNEWTKSAYLELSTSINTFNTSTLHQYKLSSTMNAKNAETTSSAVKVSASASAANMNHTVDVKGLSANAYLIGTNKLERAAITSSTVDNQSIKLADVLFSDLTQQTKTDGKTYVRGHVAAVTATGIDQTASDGNGQTWGTQYTFGKTTETYQKVLNVGDSQYSDAAAYWRKDNGNGTYTNYSSDIDPTQAPGAEPQSSLYSDPSQYTKDHEIWQARTDYAANPGAFSKVIDAQRDVSTLGLDEVAFSFMITDGTKKISDMTDAEKAAHTISYTYDDLLNGGVTLTDLASKIKNLGTNISASYDVARDQFTIFNKESGLANTIEISIGADTGDSTKSRAAIATRNFFTNLGLYQSENGTLKGNNGATGVEVGDGKSLQFALNNTKTVTGDDNEIVIDGVTYKEATNKVTVGGVTYTALSKTTGPTTVTVSQDTDAIIEKVKSFVSDYNKLLSSLYEKYDEKSDSNYKPLTQSQKDSMKEEQITKWEEKAKSGLLYHDQTIGKIIQNMRSAITQSVEQEDGSSVSIFSLGISTTGLKGQLQLDEDKLKKALSEDSDIVAKVFTVLPKDETGLSASQITSQSGVAQRLGDVFTAATKSIRTRAGSSSDITEDSDLNNLLRNLQTRMSNFKKMMSTFETALYKKYDAMESALAKLGTQLSFIMGGNS